jgi:hypothetical protein
MAASAEVVEAMAEDLGAGSTPAEVSDAVLVQPPSSWDEASWRLLGLAGLALWSWQEKPVEIPVTGAIGIECLRESERPRSGLGRRRDRPQERYFEKIRKIVSGLARKHCLGR